MATEVFYSIMPIEGAFCVRHHVPIAQETSYTQIFPTEKEAEAYIQRDGYGDTYLKERGEKIAAFGQRRGN